MARACSTNKEKRNSYRILVGKREGRRSLGRPRRRWEGEIKTDLREIGFGDMECIDPVQDRDQWNECSCEHGNEPSGSKKCWKIRDWLNNWWLLNKGSTP
jgi:hypothetical protein